MPAVARHISRLPPLLGLLLMLSATPLLAGVTGELKGRVVARAGDPLPGVTVVLRNDGLGVPERGTVTDAEGRYRFVTLPPGPGYRIRASLPRHAVTELSDLAVEAGNAATVDITLPLATEVSETVRVPGKAEIVNTESVTASTSFSSTFIAGLPIFGRDYQEILTLAPGVTDVNGTGNPNIHGARDTDVVTLVDGASTTDPLTGYYGQNLNIESLQEIEVITAAATAEYSRAQGGFANIITKSGGNEFQGTFKLFVRTDRLDGDGAGIDPPELTGGLPGADSFRELRFTDLKPFLSLSGPFIRDRLWYYLANQFILEETPVNTLSQAYVRRTRGYREFFKTTWQINPSHRLSFGLTLDRLHQEDLGITSLRAAESGFAAQRGGPTYNLRETAVFTPTVLLESTVAWFDNRTSITPTLDPDTNGNGILFVDGRPDLGGNGNGVLEPRERDPGEDWDFDGRYDVFEDLVPNGNLDLAEDRDGDRRVTPVGGCEGLVHEDLNCNGRLDYEYDRNLNGRVDPEEDQGIPCEIFGRCPDGYLPGTWMNGRFDTEDADGSYYLDVLPGAGLTPFPFWLDRNGNALPDHGEFSLPLAPDQDLITDEQGRTTGPAAYESHDHRKRLTLRTDLSLYAGDWGGTHDIKLGVAYEHEGYDSDTQLRPRFFYPVETNIARDPTPQPPPTTHHAQEVLAQVGIPSSVNNTAVGDTLGMYLQDTFKPLPNLTFGLGVRVDLESVNSFGYTPFDPQAERARFDVLYDAAGYDTTPYDSVLNQGLCRDPIRNCSASQDAHYAAIIDTLKAAAFRRLTRHNLQVEIISRTLGLTGSDPSDLNKLAEAGIPVRRPEEFTLTNANLAPRLSVSWDPWADGKTKTFAAWGRYYDKLFFNTVVLEQGPDTVQRSYLFDADGVNARGLPDNRLGAVASQSPLSAFQVDRSLATPFSDEWTVGLQRELAPELAISLRYIRRDYRKQLQDIDVNHHTEIDSSTGEFADRDGLARCGIYGCDNLFDGLPDLYISNFFFNRVFRLGNYNRQTYRGWELELVRRLSRKWQLQASYTYSVARGDAEDYLSEIGDDPALSEWEPGFLNYDQRHVIKLNAVAFLPHEWQIGGTASWASGLPYSATMQAQGVDDFGYYQNRRLFVDLAPSGFGVTREARNIHRNAAVYRFNARVQRNFILGKAAASAFFEVYNLLNQDSLRVSNLEQIPPRIVEGSPGTETTPGTPDVEIPGYEVMKGERDFGRRFQFGLQLDF